MYFAIVSFLYKTKPVARDCTLIKLHSYTSCKVCSSLAVWLFSRPTSVSQRRSTVGRALQAALVPSGTAKALCSWMQSKRFCRGHRSSGAAS